MSDIDRPGPMTNHSTARRREDVTSEKNVLEEDNRAAQDATWSARVMAGGRGSGCGPGGGYLGGGVGGGEAL